MRSKYLTSRCALLTGVLVPLLLLGGCEADRRPRQTAAPDERARADFDALRDQPAEREAQRIEGSELAFTSPDLDEALRIERFGDEKPRVGQLYEYGYRVQNTSEEPIHNVVIRQNVPAGVTIERSTPEAQQQQSARGVTEQVWLLGTLPPGAERVIRVEAVPQEPGELQTCAVVDYSPSSCFSTSVTKPELALSRTVLNEDLAPQDRFYSCAPMVIRYTLTNHGTGTTQEARIIEQLPSGVTTMDGAQQVELVVDPLTSGESVEKLVRVRAQAGGTFTSRAKADTGQLQAVSALQSVQVLDPVLALDLSGPQKEYLNRPITYTATVKNVSQAPALNTVLNVQVPRNVRNVSVSPNRDVEGEGETYRIGMLEPGESAQIAFTMEGHQPGQLQATATASAYCVRKLTDTATTDLVGVPAVLVEVVDVHDPVEVGQQTAYDIQVKNQGTAPDLNILIEAQLPEEMQLVGVDGDTNAITRGNTVQLGPIPELAPGQVISWRVRAEAQRPARTAFSLQLQSEANQQRIIEMEPTTIY